jgi:hypothetical protein
MADSGNGRGNDDFWSPKTAHQIAAEQGIRGPQQLDQLAGAAADLWASDEEFDHFLAAIDRHHQEPTST